MSGQMPQNLTPQNPTWDREVDILVVGSGAGGLLTALVAADRHADVLVIEKSGEYGGTSATSGGGIWIPNSHLAPPDVHQDSPEEAFQYIRQLADHSIPDDNIRAYVRSAPEMLRWVVDNTPVRYQSLPYTDYHAEVPGGKLGYRTHLPVSMDGRLLGDDILALRSASPAASLFGVINWQFMETFALLFRTKGWLRTAAGMLARYYGDIRQRLRSPKDRFLTLGTALIGGLRLAAKQRNLPLWLNTPLSRLIEEDGRIIGAEIRRDGKPMRIKVRRGVVLAAGGFERDPAMRALHLPAVADPRLSGSQENNTGDTLRLAMSLGAGTLNLDHTWAAPVFSFPGESRSRLSTIERALPGCIIVNQAGRRYLNEAASYHIVGQQMVAADRPDARTIPSWLVFDAGYRRRYPVGPILPLIPDWLQPRKARAVLKKSATIDGLARAMGVPPENLRETLSSFNDGAKRGEDPAFGRGAAAYDRMYGDFRVQPNPALGAVETPPFYAIPMYPGDIGTSGGLKTNVNAEVLRDDGRPIAGLYAIGNTAASVMGGSYPGAGSTLGPAMTFGYIAARHLTNCNDDA